MNEIEVLDISRDAIFTLLKVVSPILLVALFIGLIVGIFQALTQIQEMTLAFVPKIIAVFASMRSLDDWFLQTFVSCDSVIPWVESEVNRLGHCCKVLHIICK